MNKNIALLIFATFATINTAQTGNATSAPIGRYNHVMDDYEDRVKAKALKNGFNVGGYGPDALILTIQEIKRMPRTDKRDSNGLSTISSTSGKHNPPYEYYPADHRDYLKDVLRNQPEFGGPANALDLVRDHYVRLCGASSLYGNHATVLCQMMNAFYLVRHYIL